MVETIEMYSISLNSSSSPCWFSLTLNWFFSGLESGSLPCDGTQQYCERKSASSIVHSVSQLFTGGISKYNVSTLDYNTSSFEIVMVNWFTFTIFCLAYTGSNEKCQIYWSLGNACYAARDVVSNKDSFQKQEYILLFHCHGFTVHKYHNIRRLQRFQCIWYQDHIEKLNLKGTGL